MSDILFDCAAGIATVTLNRPEARNALTPAMVQAWTEFMRSIEADRAVRCVVIKGAGEHFMAGGDVKSFAATLKASADERRAMFEQRVQNVAPLLIAMQRAPQIVVAAVRGAAAGAGVSFVAAADLALAARSSFFVLSQIKIGVSPDGSATYNLPRQLGPKRAKELALLGDRFDALQAEAWGLVNHVVEDADLDRRVDELATRLAAGPAQALAQTKRLVNRSLSESLPAQLQLEAEAFALCAAGPDFAEGLGAFLERRPADFRPKADPSLPRIG